MFHNKLSYYTTDEGVGFSHAGAASHHNSCAPRTVQPHRTNSQEYYEQTTIPFNLVYVSGKSPVRIQRYLQLESQRRGFRLIPAAGYLAPNQARNLGIREANTKYTVFLDNDVSRLTGVARGSGSVCGRNRCLGRRTVYFIGEFEKQIIHMAGATVHFKDRDGKRVLYEEQYYLDTPLAALPGPLLRRPCDHLEFHSCSYGLKYSASSDYLTRAFSVSMNISTSV